MVIYRVCIFYWGTQYMLSCYASLGGFACSCGTDDRVPVFDFWGCDYRIFLLRHLKTHLDASFLWNKYFQPPLFTSNAEVGDVSLTYSSQSPSSRMRQFRSRAICLRIINGAATVSELTINDVKIPMKLRSCCDHEIKVWRPPSRSHNHNVEITKPHNIT